MKGSLRHSIFLVRYSAVQAILEISQRAAWSRSEDERKSAVRERKKASL
jgi:uncharacterized small protein (DUF1192 family)